MIERKTKVKQFHSFSTEYYLLRLLSQVRLKIIFHWKAQLLITDRSLRKVAALDWMSLTTEKRDVPSAKSLQFEDTPFDKSLI